MFNFSSGGLDFGSGGGGGGGGRGTERLLIGALALLVVGSLGFVVWYEFMSHRSTVDLPKENHMFCTNCNKEVLVPVGQSLGNHSSSGASGAAPLGRPSGGLSAGPSEGSSRLDRGMCPVCGKPALILERMCPKCKHYYVTEWDKTHNFMDINPQADTETCLNCGVNIEEYRKSHPYGD